MDRRFLKVLGTSVVLAIVVAAVFYRISAGVQRPQQPKVVLRDLVTATKPIPIGVTIKLAEVTVVHVPADLFPKGGFGKPEEVVDRPVISNILAEEPIVEGRLAARGSGSGLAPMIPTGMRAVSVRVNDVVGVAGFVLPGMRVDVLVTGRPPDYNGSVTQTVLQNIIVLSAGQTIQPEPKGQAINTPVVTLMVTPEQAEILTLANGEGKIQLVLRNTTDQTVEKTPGRDLAELFGLRKRRAPLEAVPQITPRPKRAVKTVAPVTVAPPPPVPQVPAPVPEEIVIIRGNQKKVEVVGLRNVQ